MRILNCAKCICCIFKRQKLVYTQFDTFHGAELELKKKKKKLKSFFLILPLFHVAMSCNVASKCTHESQRARSTRKKCTPKKNSKKSENEWQHFHESKKMENASLARVCVLNRRNYNRSSCLFMSNNSTQSRPKWARRTFSCWRSEKEATQRKVEGTRKLRAVDFLGRL